MFPEHTKHTRIGAGGMGPVCPRAGPRRHPSEGPFWPSVERVPDSPARPAPCVHSGAGGPVVHAAGGPGAGREPRGPVGAWGRGARTRWSTAVRGRPTGSTRWRRGCGGCRRLRGAGRRPRRCAEAWAGGGWLDDGGGAAAPGRGRRPGGCTRPRGRGRGRRAGTRRTGCGSAAGSGGVAARLEDLDALAVALATRPLEAAVLAAAVVARSVTRACSPCFRPTRGRWRRVAGRGGAVAVVAVPGRGRAGRARGGCAGAARRYRAQEEARGRRSSAGYRWPWARSRRGGGVLAALPLRAGRRRLGAGRAAPVGRRPARRAAAAAGGGGARRAAGARGRGRRARRAP